MKEKPGRTTKAPTFQPTRERKPLVDGGPAKPFVKPLKEGVKPRVELDMSHIVSWGAKGQERKTEAKTGSKEGGGDLGDHPPHQSQEPQLHAFLSFMTPRPTQRPLGNIDEAVNPENADSLPLHKPEPPPPPPQGSLNRSLRELKRFDSEPTFGSGSMTSRDFETDPSGEPVDADAEPSLGDQLAQAVMVNGSAGVRSPAHVIFRGLLLVCVCPCPALLSDNAVA